MHSLLKLLGVASIALLVSCGGDDEDLAGQCSAIGLTEKTSTEIVPKITSGRVCTDVNKSPVLAILKNMPDGTSGLCTGTLITSTQVLTAAHCLSGAASIDVIYGIAAEQYARLRTRKPGLSLLRFKARCRATISQSTSSGERLRSIIARGA